jgi:hypothetical protein
MGIFDEEAKKMADEAAQEARSAAQQENELNAIALKVSEDLLSHLGKHPMSGEDIEVSVHHNRITLRGRSSGRTLEITCKSCDKFDMQEASGFQRQVTVQPRISTNNVSAIDKSGMARRVMAWLQEQRAA